MLSTLDEFEEERVHEDFLIAIDQSWHQGRESPGTRQPADGVAPPRQPEETAVSHCVGPQQPEQVPEDTDAPPPYPRLILLKFVSRWSKWCVMAEQKSLHNQKPDMLRPHHKNNGTQDKDYTETDEGGADQKVL